MATAAKKFRTQYSTATFYSNTGSPFHTTYEVGIDDKGHKTLQESGSTNTYAKIQEHLEETLIENILQRAELGDTEALNRVEGKFLDTTQMPKTLAEAQNKIISIKNEFEKLPLEIRKQFDHSPEKYIQEYGSEYWMKSLGYIKEAPIEDSVRKEEAKKSDE